MFPLFIKEVKAYFNSLIGYITLTFFWVILGLFVWVFPQTSVLEGGFASLSSFFMIAPYVFIFLIPAITMRSFSEEKKEKTLELLLTKPLSEFEIILGKYLGSLFLVLIAILPTTIYYFSIYKLGQPEGNIDTAAVIGSYLGLLFLASVFTSIGITASSISDNQIVAFLLSVFLCFFFYDGFSSIAAIDLWSSSSFILQKFGIDYHYNSISRGLVDSRDLFYFLSITVVFLFLTKFILSSRKWR